MVYKRVPWNRDELLLALDLYLRKGALIPTDHPDVLALSHLLRKLPFPKATIDPKYRSPGAVHLKLQNFLAIDPSYVRPAMPHGAQADRQVWNEFASDPAQVATLARQITQVSNFPPPADKGDDDDGLMFPEGRILYSLHRRYERDRKLVGRARARYLRRHGRVFCEACGFDFQETYGERGLNWMEVHHDVPVSRLGPDGHTSIRDLRLVCANCHRMIHNRRPWLTVAQLREVICSQVTGTFPLSPVQRHRSHRSAPEL